MSSVAQRVTAAVPVALPHETAGTVLGRLLGSRHESVSVIFVVDDERRLTGLIHLSEVFAAPPETPISALAAEPPAPVTPQTSQEDAASVAIRSGVAAVPITDAEGRFLGALPPRAIMAILREEHLEDLHRLVGIWRSSERAETAMREPPAARLRHRLPWLAVGLAGSILATQVVSGFEATLSRNVALAFFIPLLVYLADAVGTQTETVAVRGLSLSGLGLRALLLGEAGAGLLIGAVLGLLAAAFAWISFGQPALAIVLGTSLFCACVLATTIGLLLPWSFSRLGWDPAFGSGPVGTIIQDVLSLLIYFGIATAVLGG
jgi:magnesium transporter